MINRCLWLTCLDTIMVFGDRFKRTIFSREQIHILNVAFLVLTCVANRRLCGEYWLATLKLLG